MVETSRDWLEKLPLHCGLIRLLLYLYRSHTLLIGVRYGGSATKEDDRTFKKRVKPRPLHVGDLVLRVVRGLIKDPRRKFRPQLEWTLLHQGVVPRERYMVDGFRWKSILRVDQYGSTKEVLMFETNVDHFVIHLGFDIPFASSLHISLSVHFASFVSSIDIRVHMDHLLSRFVRHALLGTQMPLCPSIREMHLGSVVRLTFFGIIMILGWSRLGRMDSHIIISLEYMLDLLCIPIELLMGHQDISEHLSRLMEPLSDLSIGLRVEAARYTGAYSPHCSLAVRHSEPPCLPSYDLSFSA
ncbi:hypothetical protein CK203_087900 [Vitis vinifera]|uniref:Uncharacterized protein n=1 Tax=Vitis vinifera TaxID=29760 RepID=A0A438DQY1_VITVI|nr:hypothetical protein CK203_087900 [Vitis vinifera]